MALNLVLERGLAEAGFLRLTGPQSHPSVEVLVVQLVAQWGISGRGRALPHPAARSGERITVPGEMGRVKNRGMPVLPPSATGGGHVLKILKRNSPGGQPTIKGGVEDRTFDWGLDEANRPQKSSSPFNSYEGKGLIWNTSA